MKNLFTLTLVALFALAATTASAQKLATINTQELIVLMPEFATMQTNLQVLQNDLQNTGETMQVEFNTKVADYQKNINTMTESVRNLKERDLSDLRNRIAEFEQSAQQELQMKQTQLLEPIITKAREAIDAVAKAQGIAMVFDISTGSIAYTDESQCIDLLPAVKTKLGIPANAKPAM